MTPDATLAFVHATTSLGPHYCAHKGPGVSYAAERALLLARPGDPVFLLQPVDPAYLALLRDLGVGCGEPPVVVGAPGISGTLPELLLESDAALHELRARARPDRVLILDPFVALEPELRLAQHWARSLGRAVALPGGSPRLVRGLARKHEVSTQALRLGIPLAPGEVIDVGPRESGRFAAAALRDAIRRWLRRAGRVIVRGSEAAGGESTFLLDDEGAGFAQALERIAADTNRFFLVEPQVDVASSPNVLMHVDRDGAVGFVAATDQRLDERFVYHGSSSPSRARHLASMIRAARALADWIARAGYSGPLGFDFVESPEPRHAPAWFLAELNARTNGASYPVALARRLDAAQVQRGAPRIRGFVSGSEPGPPSSVAELFRRCRHLFFDRDLGRGVIPYGPGYLPHGQLHALALAASRDEAEALYHDFRCTARRET